MIPLHEIRQAISAERLLAARALGRNYHQIRFRIRDEHLWLRLRPGDSWTQLGDLAYWSYTYVGPRESEELALERFLP
jgi:hypothetical protein